MKQEMRDKMTPYITEYYQFILSFGTLANLICESKKNNINLQRKYISLLVSMLAFEHKIFLLYVFTLSDWKPRSIHHIKELLFQGMAFEKQSDFFLKIYNDLMAMQIPKQNEK